MSRHDPSIKPVPLSDLDPDETLRCTCNMCAHEKFLSIAMLVERLGSDFPIPDVRKVVTCSACGVKADASIEVDWSRRLRGVAGHVTAFPSGGHMVDAPPASAERI